MAIARGRADLRDHGAAYGCGWQRPAGCALFGCERIAGGRDGPDVLADERLPFGALAEADRQPRGRGSQCPPAASSTTLRPRQHSARDQGCAHSASASWRLRRIVGNTISRNSTATSASSVALIGRRRKTEKSPSASSIARRKFSSSCGPSTRPSSSGAGSTPTLMKKYPSSAQPSISQALNKLLARPKVPMQQNSTIAGNN